MSELADTTIERLPGPIKEEYVRQMIETLQEVATGDRQDDYAPLPMLLEENMELAYLITDAQQNRTITSPSGKIIVYHRGVYGGETLEFATRYEEGETKPEAWGVRRTCIEARKYPHTPAIKLPPAAMDVFVQEVLEDISQVQVAAKPYRLAA